MVEDKALVADALVKGAEGFVPIVRRYQSAVASVALVRPLDLALLAESAYRTSARPLIWADLATWHGR
jgi:hypothetical protein